MTPRRRSGAGGGHDNLDRMRKGNRSCSHHRQWTARSLRSGARRVIADAMVSAVIADRIAFRIDAEAVEQAV
jgi:hypothetical protein